MARIFSWCFAFFCEQNFGFNPDFVEAVQIFWGFSLETFPLPAAFMAACCALISAKAKTQKSQTKRKLSKADHLYQTRNSERENLKPKENNSKAKLYFSTSGSFYGRPLCAHLSQNWNPPRRETTNSEMGRIETKRNQSKVNHSFQFPADFIAAHCALISAKAETPKSQTKRKQLKADHLCQTRNM